MTDDREPFREARAAWKAKHHEQRLENATYTAAEVKVLTEVAMRLGRKEAGEEIAEACLGQRIAYEEGSLDDFTKGWNGCAVNLSEFAREIGSQPSPDATTARTDPPRYSDLPQDSQAVRSPQEDS